MNDINDDVKQLMIERDMWRDIALSDRAIDVPELYCWHVRTEGALELLMREFLITRAAAIRMLRSGTASRARAERLSEITGLPLDIILREDGRGRPADERVVTLPAGHAER